MGYWCLMPLAMIFQLYYDSQIYRKMLTLYKSLTNLIIWPGIKLTLSEEVSVMVFNTTLNNISVISWWSVLLVDEGGVHGENHQPVASH